MEHSVTRMKLNLKMFGIAVHLANVASAPIAQEISEYMDCLDKRIIEGTTAEEFNAIEQELEKLRIEILEIQCQEEYLELMKKYPKEE